MNLRRISALLALATFASLILAPATSAGPLQQQERAASCTVEEGGAIDVVVLIDQSKSLAPEINGTRSDALLRQLSSGLGKVAQLLSFVADDGVSVSLGAIEFSSTARVSRPLTPLVNASDIAMVQQGVLDTNDLGNDTDYVKALEAAVSMFDSSTSGANCKILIWFTDGVAEPTPKLSEDSDPRNQDYVRRVVDDLRSAVCGEPSGSDQSSSSIASRLQELDVVTYALMISDKVEQWLTWSPDAIDDRPRREAELLASESARFAASLEAMRAITGDDEPELGGVGAPPLSAQCGRFIREDGQESDGVGQVVAESGQLAGYLFLAISTSTGDDPEGVCPTEINQVDGGWTSDLLPPGRRYERIAVAVLDGELEDPESAQIIAGGGSTTITIEQSGYLRQSEVTQIKTPWRLQLSPSPSSDSLRFCVLYKLSPFNTTQIGLQPLESGFSDSGVAIGESSIEFSIDWSNLETRDGLDPSSYLESVRIESPVGPVSVSSDFSRATLDVTAMPAALDASIQQYLSDQFKVTLTPASRVTGEEPRLIGAAVSPRIPLRNNENAPVLTCEGDADLSIREESDGKQRLSKRSCIVTPPLSGLATVTLRGVNPETDESISWIPVDDELQPLAESITLTSEDEPITVRFATQALDKARYWKASGSGEIALTWSENNMRSTDESRFDIDLLPSANFWRAILIAALATAAASVLSLLLLWQIGRLLIRLPKASEFYYRKCSIEASSNINGPKQNFAGDLERALKTAENKAVHDSKRRSSIQVGSYTLTRRVPIWPPFAAPDIAVDPDDSVCVVPPGNATNSLAVQFDSALIVCVPDPKSLLTDDRVLIKAHFLYRAGASEALNMLTTRSLIVNDGLSSFLAATSTRLREEAKVSTPPGPKEKPKTLRRLSGTTGSVTTTTTVEVAPEVEPRKGKGRGQPTVPSSSITADTKGTSSKGQGRTSPLTPPSHTKSRGKGRGRPSS